MTKTKYGFFFPFSRNIRQRETGNEVHSEEEKNVISFFGWVGGAAYADSISGREEDERS